MPKKNPCPTNLETARRMAGLSRKQLSDLTGVSLRTTEAYEQRKSDICRASVGTVKKISDILKCPIEVIIE